MSHSPLFTHDATNQPFTLRRDAWDRLVLTLPDGHSFPDVEPVRAFPFSAPQQWISLCDAAGHEIVCLPSLEGLEPEVYQILQEELQRRQFVPTIRRIIAVSADEDPSQWTVETDRGETRFLLGSDDDIRHLSPSRVLMVDVHGVRFLIPDLELLDAASRRILDRYL